jgi:GMP synthase-like glutamine amidotransferase
VTHQTIVVLDFGSQFTQLIARRLRELSVYSEILPFDTPLAEIQRRKPVGIILSGGPTSVLESGAPRCDPAVVEAGVPVLGICYGMQLMTDLLGGKVAPAQHREFGLATIAIQPEAPLFQTIPAELRVPWRLRQVGARRVRRHSHERERAGGGDGGAGTRTLCAPVPSGSGAHGPRTRPSPQFRLRRVRVHGRLDDVVVRAGGD